MKRFRFMSAIGLAVSALACGGYAAEIRSAGQAARLEIRAAGDHSVRITLKPLSYEKEFP